MSPRLLLALLMACGLAGCGGAERSGVAPPMTEAPPQEAAAKKEVPAGADAAAVAATLQPQMIVYTATLDVVVKDLDAVLPEVEKLVTGHKGFVSRSEVRGDTGSRRTATFTLRVPVAGFAALKEGLLALGTSERNAVETQDVTEEFVDVEARIKNLQEQEKKLNELLLEKRKEEKLEDVIKVSDRIYVVRGDIERAQGRRNFLQNRVQLSTINLTLREVKDYKPPTAPTFGTRISDTFSASWEAVVEFGKGVVLFGVALAPWAPLWLPLVLVAAWGIRKLVRISRENAARLQAERERHPRHHRTRDGEPMPTAAPVEPLKSPEEPGPVA